jgi:type I restriction enzyme R subunit
MFGLSAEVLAAIQRCLRRHPDIAWAKIYGSRAKGNYRPGSDIDLAFSSNTDYAAQLLAELDELPTPYLFDVTHYESVENAALKEHVDRVGVEIYRGDRTPPLARDA